MRKVAVAAMLCVLSLSLGAQMKVPTKPAPGAKKTPLQATRAANNPANFPRISIADAKKLYDTGQAVFVDVRSNEQFSYGHIKGALSIPGSQLVRRYAEVAPLRKTVILYCACSAEQSSGRAANDLIAHGVKNVFALKGGWNEWKSAGHATAVGPK